MGRILIRIIMMSGATALVNWRSRRQEAKARANGQSDEQARRQSQTLKRSFRLLRRFMRF